VSFFCRVLCFVGFVVLWCESKRVGGKRREQEATISKEKRHDIDRIERIYRVKQRKKLNDWDGVPLPHVPHRFLISKGLMDSLFQRDSHGSVDSLDSHGFSWVPCKLKSSFSWWFGSFTVCDIFG